MTYLSEVKHFLQALALVTIWFGAGCSGLISDAHAQMPGPFHEEEQKALREMQKNSVLTQDSVVMVDTVELYDPDTFEKEVRIIRENVSIWDYCIGYLGIDNPNILLDGSTIEVTDPRTYEPLRVRWNHNTQKIDTIR